MALSGCGGSVASPVDGGSPVVTSPSTDGVPSATCPSDAQIDTQAAVGKSCAADGAYCLNPSCDACLKNCPAVRCTRGVWTPAVNTASCTPTADAGVSIDTGGPSDGGACVEIDLSSYDQTCKEDTDCAAAGGGTFCAGGPFCNCPSSTINVDGMSRYKAALEDARSRIAPGVGGCLCPTFGSPRCVSSHCKLCGGLSGETGCPDAG